MKTNWKNLGCGVAGAAALVAVAGCGGGGQQGAVAVQEQAKKVVVIPPLQPNVVANWNEIATNTRQRDRAFPAVTDEERRGGPDLATVQLAVYDAVMAIVGTHKPYAANRGRPAPALRRRRRLPRRLTTCSNALFPNRAPVYKPSYAQLHRLAASWRRA